MSALLNISTFESLMNGYNKENANLVASSITSEKEIVGHANKTFALEYDLPRDVAKAHREGVIHLHDLDFYASRSNCMNHPIEIIFREGLNVLTCASGPAKHFQSAINHILKALHSMQGELAGGQGIPMFNVFLAPFARGATDAEIYQGVQHFIYECNQLNASRGMQTIFSNVNCEYSIPDFMKDEEVKYSKEIGSTFGEYEVEARKILDAVCSVLLKKDFEGKPFLFPNFITVIRKETDPSDELFKKVIQVNLEVNNAYYINMMKYGTNLGSAMGCRTWLDDSYTGDWKKDVFATGNFEYVTINLPRIAILNKMNRTPVEELLDNAIRLATKGLFKRRENIVTKYENNKYRFMKMYDTEDYGHYNNYDRTTMGVGFVGLSEFLTLMNADRTYGLEFMTAFKRRVDNLNKVSYHDLARSVGVEYTERDEKPRWSLIGSPAESCSYRLKSLDNKLYGRALKSEKLYTKKYYTNSFHVPESSDVTALDKLHDEEQFHKLCNGGSITHVWNPEIDTNIDSVAQFTYNILKSSNVRYMTYSPTLVYCKACKSLYSGEQSAENCKCCGSPNITTYAKITGYLADTGNWNEGKRQELMNRHDFKVD
ncbi:ribonucleoside-triphosphate reductase [Methanococcus maripaludis]|uniref:Ribonucleoside-triphosphate reductase n=1 Tax=Methanococcus maripaludis TaxID=39152 RepID=A0A7J9NXL0_METMI|nr:anaerobic ribonucleoside-triphosphate reductase [Methanococcus maripaludis]MBA2851753.1 ribonucleoside-triphosphate reductase [Methanococcus maripaludis]